MLEGKTPNERTRELCRVRKWVDESIDGDVFRRSGYTEKMKYTRIEKRVYVMECMGSHSVFRPQGSWIDSVNDRLKKGGLAAG